MLNIDRLILRLPPELATRKRAIGRALRTELARLDTTGADGRETLSLPPLAMRAGETSTALARRIGTAVGQSLRANSNASAARTASRPTVKARGASQTRVDNR